MIASAPIAGTKDTSRLELTTAVAELGAKWNPDILAATNALFADKVETAAPDVERIADLAYGDHPRQKLDVYVPEARNAPALLFLPGGGFTSGGKDEHPSFYRNFGTYFAKHGILTFIANYRLAPEFRWPEQTEDAGAAIAWAGANAQHYGGSPGGLSIIGHSAGAVNIAGFLLHPSYAGHPRPDLKQVVLISGVYGFSEDAPANVQLYAGDPAGWPDKSPISHIERCDFPLTLCAGELDPEQLVRPTLDLAAAFARAKGHCLPLHVLSGHNHVSTVRSIGSADDALGALLRSIIR